MDRAEIIILKCLLTESSTTVYRIADISKRYEYESPKTHRSYNGVPLSTIQRKVKSLRKKALVECEQEKHGRKSKNCMLTMRGLFFLAIEQKNQLTSTEFDYIVDRVFALLDLRELSSIKQLLSVSFEKAINIAKRRINLEHFDEEWAIQMFQLAMVESWKDLALHDPERMKEELKKSYEEMAESDSQIKHVAYAVPYLLNSRIARNALARNLKKLRDDVNRGVTVIRKEIARFDKMIRFLKDERSVRKATKELKKFHSSMNISRQQNA